MRLYHGSHNALMGTKKLHEGICMTTSRDAAENYAGAGAVYEVEVEDTASNRRCEGYSHEDRKSVV